MLVTASWLSSADRDGFHLRHHQIDPAPAPEVTSGFRHIGFRQVEAAGRKARPGLLEKVEKASGTATGVEHLEAALVAAGEHLVQRHQRLSPYRIGRTVEQHLDLGVVAPRRFRRHPAARLEVEVLQVVARPPAERVPAHDLPGMTELAPTMDLGKIREEQAGAPDKLQRRAVMIRRQGIDAGFHIGEILPEQDGHIRVEPPAVRHRRIGARLAPRARAGTCRLREAPHDEAVADVPGHARQLPRTVGSAGGEAGDRIDHAASSSGARPSE